MDIQKFCAVYNNNFQSNSGQKSVHWKNFHEKIPKIIESTDLINFRQYLTTGFDDASLVNRRDELFSYLLARHSEDVLLKYLPKLNIGNCPYSISYKQAFYDYNTLIHLSWYLDCIPFVDKKHQMVICEIGSGFGSLARFFIANNNCKYILVDFTQSNIPAAYFLSSYFPTKKIYLADNLKITTIDDILLSNFDIIIVEPGLFEISSSIDFFINSRSFMEMDRKTINNYFEIINTKTKKNSLFLNINRYKKILGNEVNYFYQYPYTTTWKTIISRPSINQKHIHFLLAKKTSSFSTITISLLFIKFKSTLNDFFKKIP